MHRLIGVAIVVMLASNAAAQDRYNLAVTQDQLNLIGKALGKLPFEEVSPTINDLGNQVLTQQRKNAEAAQGAEQARIDKLIADRLKETTPP